MESMATTIAPPVSSQSGGISQKPVVRAPGLAADRASRSGIWVAIFAITMSFAAFTSALFVREGTADWSHMALPSTLYLNTLILLASSATFAFAQRSLSASPLLDASLERKNLPWLVLTLVLGLGFCFGQYAVWLQLRAQGLYLATNPNSSFFYVLTAVHALHLIGGILALTFVIGRLLVRRSPLRRSFLENTAIYWHFMGVVWLYLFLLCRLKL